MAMKNIAKDVEDLDVYVRDLWGQESRLVMKKNDNNSTYYASTTSFNWFGFLESINECVESPTWYQVKRFVEYYCKKRKVDSSSYILLYENLESMGYSSTFKTTVMNRFYKRTLDSERISNPFYQQIIDFFKLESK